MLRRFGSHIRNQWMGALALFIALGGTTVAATGAIDGPAPNQNSVGSLDIMNGQVQNPDIQDNSVGGAKVKNSSIASADVLDRSLGGVDVANNSLGGAQIAESNLGEVPNATISGHGGYGRQSGGPETGASCNPSDDLWFTCTSVGLTPSAPARFFVTGRFTAAPDDEFGYAECRLGSSAFGGIPGTTIPLYVSERNNVRETVTLTGITEVYQPGTYSFGIDCRETGSSDYGAHIDYARITAVAISPF